MKRSMVLGCFFVLGFLLSCTKDESVALQQGTVTFSPERKSRQGGRVSEVAKPASVLLSIQDHKGKMVYENKKLPLLTFGDSYVSESLDHMATGSYKLTQFQVLDAAGKVIYATPLKGTELAQYVNSPLPIDFVVVKDEVTKLVPQVLEVKADDDPIQFGYASFTLDIIKVKKLATKEWFSYDVAKKEFTPEYKRSYTYKQHKLIRVDEREYYPNLVRYGPPRQVCQYDYDNNGRLVKSTWFPAVSTDYRRVEEYEYPNQTTVKVSIYNLTGSTVQAKSQEWVTIVKTPTSIQARYYDYNNLPNGQVDCKVDENGNITSIVGYGLSILDVKYDHAPNPEYRPYVLEQPFFQRTYSRNNVIRDDTTIKYDADGYPVERVEMNLQDSTLNSKTVYTY